LLVGIVHGIVQGAVVFLVGLVAFAALVWLPATRSMAGSRDAGPLLVRGVWVLFGLLAIAGLAEVSLYAVRASGEPFGLGLLGQALFETRVGNVWLARLGFALVTCLVAAWAAQDGGLSFWWAATGVGSVLLLTLTQLSHTAAEGGFLPFASDWLHVLAASLWMGGLLGFPLLIFGPLRSMPAEDRTKLLGKAVRRFSRGATVAVTVIVVTGLYATLLHVPDLQALVSTPYGRALIMKLGLLVLLLATGGINLIDRGREPFSRMVGAELVLAVLIFVAAGFLTSLPPPPGGPS